VANNKKYVELLWADKYDRFEKGEKYPENYPKDWKNLLILGDNKLVMSSLVKQGWTGGINLIYIDPHFFTGADFPIKTKVGDEAMEKAPSVIEEQAYSDTWSGGIALCLRYMCEWLVLMWELLAEERLYLCVSRLGCGALCEGDDG